MAIDLTLGGCDADPARLNSKIPVVLGLGLLPYQQHVNPASPSRAFGFIYELPQLHHLLDHVWLVSRPHSYTPLRDYSYCRRCKIRNSMADSHDFGPLMVGLLWPLAALSGAFLCARLYAKISRNVRLWWDDWVLIFAWVS